MSNGRAFRRQLANMLGALDGARIPGGCEHCDAFQTVKPISAGMWNIDVHHDYDCPRLSPKEIHR